jgi:hypothetical protein
MNRQMRRCFFDSFLSAQARIKMVIAVAPFFLLACAHPQTSRSTASSRTETHPTKVVESRETPTRMTCHQLSYFGFGTTLAPGEAIEFAVPAAQRKKPVAFVTLGHGALTGYEDHDESPALTSLQFRSTEDSRWKYWGGPSSGEAGAKFAEYRWGGLELEGLYEWGNYGFLDLESNAKSTAPLLVDRVRAVSTGKDPVRIGEVSIVFWPNKRGSLREHVFVPGTNFGDYLSSRGASYSLDRASAWEIGHSGETKSDPSGAELANGSIVLPLAAGEKLRSVEVACGDDPESGGSPGSAFLSIRLQRADGSSESWKENENVPPTGILKAGSPDCDFVAKEGDRLEITGGGDRVWVMGVRLGFE